MILQKITDALSCDALLEILVNDLNSDRIILSQTDYSDFVVLSVILPSLLKHATASHPLITWFSLALQQTLSNQILSNLEHHYFELGQTIYFHLRDYNETLQIAPQHLVSSSLTIIEETPQKLPLRKRERPEFFQPAVNTAKKQKIVSKTNHTVTKKKSIDKLPKKVTTHDKDLVELIEKSVLSDDITKKLKSLNLDVAFYFSSFKKLSDLGFDKEQCNKIILKRSPQNTISALTENFPKLINLFTLEEIQKLSKGGVTIINEIAQHYIDLIDLGFKKNEIVQITSNKTSAKTIKILKERYNSLINLQFNHSQIVKLAANGGYLSMTHILDNFEKLKNLGLTHLQITNLGSHGGGTNNIDGVLTHTETLLAIGFSLAQIISVASIGGGKINLEMIIGNFESLFKLNYTPTQIIQMTKNCGGSLNLSAVLEHTEKFIELDFTLDEIVNLVNHPGGSKNLIKLLEHYHSLTELHLDKKQILKIAAHGGGAKNIEAVIKYFDLFKSFNFNAEQIVFIVSHGSGSKNLKAVKDNFHILKDLGYAAEQIIKMVKRTGGGKAIITVKNNYNELIKLGFTKEDIIELASHSGGSKTIELVISYFIQLTNSGFTPRSIIELINRLGSSIFFKKYLQVKYDYKNSVSKFLLPQIANLNWFQYKNQGKDYYAAVLANKNVKTAQDYAAIVLKFTKIFGFEGTATSNKMSNSLFIEASLWHQLWPTKELPALSITDGDLTQVVNNPSYYFKDPIDDSIAYIKCHSLPHAQYNVNILNNLQQSNKIITDESGEVIDNFDLIILDNIIKIINYGALKDHMDLNDDSFYQHINADLEEYPILIDTTSSHPNEYILINENSNDEFLSEEFLNMLYNLNYHNSENNIISQGISFFSDRLSPDEVMDDNELIPYPINLSN